LILHQYEVILLGGGGLNDLPDSLHDSALLGVKITTWQPVDCKA